jgi:predicted dehydrogenase
MKKHATPAGLSRRHFLKSTAILAAGAGLSARSWSQVNGANSDIRIAVVGFNGRGKSHINSIRGIKGTRLAALCDVDTAVLDKETQTLQKSNLKVETYTDIRKLLENKDIDAISIATPNHWHSLAGIWSCQAGKDVYVEKPVSHNVFEGRKLVEAARKYNRIVQTGTQSRSSGGLREALAWVQAGHLGKIKVARGLCYKPRPSIGKVNGAQPIPSTIDYDIWCGPAPKEPLHRQKLHYDWHWVWATGNGDLGNQGIHQMDIIRWASGKNTLSPRVISIGGRLGYEDDGETPNTQMVVHDYGDMLLIFEVRGLPEKAGSPNMDKFKGQSIGHIIECEGGYLAGTAAFDKDGKQIQKFSGKEGDEGHYANFINAVRSRKVSDLNADILEGHLSSALCHTGNISYRLGQKEDQGKIHEAIKSNPAALETLARMEDHLEANLVDLSKTKATLGVFLTMDPKTEKFRGNKAANKLLTREYRKPYVVPEKV